MRDYSACATTTTTTAACRRVAGGATHAGAGARSRPKRNERSRWHERHRGRRRIGRRSRRRGASPTTSRIEGGQDEMGQTQEDEEEVRSPSFSFDGPRIATTGRGHDAPTGRSRRCSHGTTHRDVVERHRHVATGGGHAPATEEQLRQRRHGTTTPPRDDVEPRGQRAATRRGRAPAGRSRHCPRGSTRHCNGAISPVHNSTRRRTLPRRDLTRPRPYGAIAPMLVFRRRDGPASSHRDPRPNARKEQTLRERCIPRRTTTARRTTTTRSRR